ncbi:L,D-transpeptidase [Patulibacter defluvii]|uniref:L,D-transpeptidase n=1 Tax=Patulibacter defluvii TaxID=3095358 RepID=UPI002A75C35C|nr:L,D-transpeptidase [Patulibacter sp. DM4]
MRRSLPLLLGLAAALLLAAGLVGRGTTPRLEAAVPTIAERPFLPRTAAREPARRWRHPTAAIVRPTALRAVPGGRRLARIGRRTEFGSPTVLAVVGRRPGWLAVQSPALRNGARGWIRAAHATLGGSDYEIVVDRSRRTARLRRGDRTVLRFRVAVGRPGNETPLGRFAVTDALRTSDPRSPYGCCALALTGHQPKLAPGWSGGDRLAIHGTPSPGTIGRAASLGCLRAGRSPLRRLLRTVPLGTPVVIRA